MIAEVVLSIVTSEIDKPYHYLVPDQLRETIKLGSQVVIPFGRRQEVGYVIGFVEKSEFPNLKEIVKVAEGNPLFSEKALAFAQWLAEYYFSFFVTALKLLLPPGMLKSGKGRKATEAKRGSGIVVRGSGFELTPAQANAVAKINEAIAAGKTEKFLLFGVTGSGKTEVYLRAIEAALKQGRGTITLVPEIALTPQLVERFCARFGDGIAVIHSELTLKERRLTWARVAAGEAPIVLGARSALFAPLPDIGLIILDEEYENSYKSDKSPRYQARAAAEKLAEIHGAVVILGSATPSLETFYRSETGEIERLELPRRIDDRPLPPVEVVDLREEMKRKNFGLLSAVLKNELAKTLANGEQAILFLNRLGYFTFVICRECGLTLECPHCSVALVYHTNDRRLRCGRCDYSRETPPLCPRCNSGTLRYFGSGTQRIEEEVAKLFPAARLLRYDRDTTGPRGSHDAFFATFASGQADILIGTQMVAKGLDIAKVTLIGVVSADTALHLPDFRASEHTFQLLTQVAGRAGRHHLPGKVIIQSYNPGHYAIQAAAKHNYREFYEQELANRHELLYPPFSHLVAIIVSAKEKEAAAGIAEELTAFLRKRLSGGVLGPAAAPIERLRGEWRFRLLLKGADLVVLRQAVRESLAKLAVPEEVRVTVDVDPAGLL
ncbi:MAG: primosomal protein N' [Candidatus Margulisiibacteriota bacterium]